MDTLGVVANLLRTLNGLLELRLRLWCPNTKPELPVIESYDAEKISSVPLPNGPLPYQHLAPGLRDR